jgi:hypothetical protein
MNSSTKKKSPSKPGRFAKGTSGNPSGRPPGSRNQSTILYEQLLEGGAEELIKKAIELGKGGDVKALALCLDRLLPVKRDRCINLEVRPLQKPQDLPIHFQDITTAIAEGRITPGEGESLSNILSAHAQLMTSVDVDRRLDELESHLQEVRQHSEDLHNFRKEIGKHAPPDKNHL